MINVLVIGRYGRDPAPIELVAEKVGRGSNDCYVVRCTAPDQLPQLVARAASVLGNIDLLDIFDHGSVGTMTLGGQTLFSSANDMREVLVGANIARALSPHLTETCHVRLLGCNTASELADPTSELATTVQPLISDGAGRCLLLKLARELGGHRTADGTIKMISRVFFKPDGFCGDPDALSSSSAALDHDPVKQGCRGPHIQQYYEPYTANLPRLGAPSPLVSLARRARRALFDFMVA